MKLIFIRHAEPTSDNDGLTEKGKKEARLLGEYYKNFHYDFLYASPLTRARLTAEAFANGKTITIKDFLAEFFHPIKIDDKEHINWDFMPKDLQAHQELYSPDYLKSEIAKSGNLKEHYEYVTQSFDELLKMHGYERKGIYYKVNKPNEDTVVIVCHLGMTSVLLSHLCHIPYTTFAQHFFLPPTGVVVVYTEEREEGYAQFRVREFGNVNHLKTKNEPISKHGSFCEIFNSNDRH